jgi:hypothetical protein
MQASFVKSEIFGTKYKNTSKNFNHTLSTYLYPIKDHTIGFTWDELQFQNAGETKRILSMIYLINIL